jgi:hypothetical protein
MEPKITQLTEDIRTFCGHTYDVPKGIAAAFDTLAAHVPDMAEHHVYGVTACDGERLIYRACLQEKYDNEGEKYNLPAFNIPKGKYLYIILKDWQQHIPQVSHLFDELMKFPDVKKNTICLEDYRPGNEMWLMVEHK